MLLHLIVNICKIIQFNVKRVQKICYTISKRYIGLERNVL